jgi:3-deoxy-D-manno-octulosonic-acid transferase
MALKESHPVAVWLQQAQPYRAIRKRVGGAFPVGLAPLNNPVSALVALIRWRPRALIFIEQTNQLHLVMLARLLGVKVVVANVSLTEYRTGKYRKRPFGAKRFQVVDQILAVGKEHRDRLLALGVQPDRILVTGPPVPPPPNARDRERWSSEWRERFGIRNGEPVIVAGSTYPEEERAILEAFRTVKQVAPDAKLILAPRHTSRENVDEIVRQSGISYELRSQLNGTPAKADVILLDTQGELSHVWGAATVAFVGGSLMHRGPGHSPLEPLSWCVPVTMGPSFEQQTATVGLCKEWGIVEICEDPSALARSWLQASQNEEYRRAFSERCEEFLVQGSQVYERWWRALFSE